MYNENWVRQSIDRWIMSTASERMDFKTVGEHIEKERKREREGGRRERERRKKGRKRKEELMGKGRASLFLCIVECDGRPALQNHTNLSSNFTFSVSCPINSGKILYSL